MMFYAAVKIVNNIKTELSYVLPKKAFTSTSFHHDDTSQSISTTQHLLAYISTQQTTAYAPSLKE